MSTDPRVDAYIAKSAPFARPILRRIRELVHEGCPDVEETLNVFNDSVKHTLTVTKIAPLP